MPPEQLFSDYVYRSSFSDAMLSWVKDLTGELTAQKKLTSDSLVIEAASNDGYLLQNYKAAGIPVLGVEPAANIAKIAVEEKGIPTEVAFFDADYGQDLAARGKKCDVFHAHNVFAHVPNPNPFLQGIAKILKADGVAVIEAPYVRDLVDNLEFDTIYHEHFSYFGVTAVSRLAERNGLVLADVKHVPIHGGSIRYYLAHAGTPQSENVTKMLADEAEAGLTSFDYYAAFADRVKSLCDTIRTEVAASKSAGKSVAAYGASAKGSTLLNTMGINASEIDFTVDRNPLKQNRFMPGVHIPIMKPEALTTQKPDVVLLLTWNFADEIVRQQSDFLESGSRFLIPVPQPRYLDKNGETLISG